MKPTPWMSISVLLYSISISTIASQSQLAKGGARLATALGERFTSVKTKFQHNPPLNAFDYSFLYGRPQSLQTQQLWELAMASRSGLHHVASSIVIKVSLAIVHQKNLRAGSMHYKYNCGFMVSSFNLCSKCCLLGYSPMLMFFTFRGFNSCGYLIDTINLQYLWLQLFALTLQNTKSLTT